MLEPAMLHKEAILNGLKKHIYEDEISYYSGWNGYTLPEIPNEFDGCDYRYAIIDGNKVIGYFCYTYDMHSKCLRNFGLYSFDRGNPIIGKDILYEIKRIIKEYQPHRMEWRMISGNPVEKHYDKFCKRYNGRKFVLTDVFKDRYGNYHNDVIYEIIFDSGEMMGNVSYWYKKILQSFADAITYGEYNEITKSVLEEESEETLENFILEYRQNININEFYFNAGIVTNQIVSETRTIGNDSFNAAMFALCNFMELIGFESEEDNINMTNYERIKKMNVPEMARLLESIHSDFDEHIRTINGDNVFDSFDDIEEWLESEVKDNE